MNTFTPQSTSINASCYISLMSFFTRDLFSALHSLNTSSQPLFTNKDTESSLLNGLSGPIVPTTNETMIDAVQLALWSVLGAVSLGHDSRTVVEARVAGKVGYSDNYYSGAYVWGTRHVEGCKEA